MPRDKVEALDSFRRPHMTFVISVLIAYKAHRYFYLTVILQQEIYTVSNPFNVFILMHQTNITSLGKHEYMSVTI